MNLYILAGRRPTCLEVSDHEATVDERLHFTQILWCSHTCSKHVIDLDTGSFVLELLLFHTFQSYVVSKLSAF
jgi:hypothetical protein